MSDDERPTSPESPASATNLPLGASAPQSLVLCLSGGGFRATYYHLGVIKLLRDYGLLKRVSHVFSVSGGSIMAAHLALRWNDYTRPLDETGFYDAAKELVEFGRMDLRGRIVRRTLLLGWLGPRFHRVRQLEEYYATLLHHAELKTTASAKAHFSFLATSMTTGNLCQFTPDGFDDGRHFHTAPGLPLALAVAASSAFPPMFPTVTLTRDQLHANEQLFPLAAEQLTDGGIFDNLGIHAAKLPVGPGRQRPSFGHVLVSDASASFDWQTDNAFGLVVPRTVRTTDILMQRVALLEEQGWSGVQNRVIVMPIKERVVAAHLPTADYIPQDQDVQTLVAKIRTDLDEFSLQEICALVRHGYEVALKQVTEMGTLHATPESGHPSDPCVTGMTAGWPLNPQLIPYIPLMRAAKGFTASTAKIQAVQEETSRMIDAFLGKPRPLTQLPTTIVDPEITGLRAHLVRSAFRRWNLWNSNDIACWLFLCTLAAGLLWWIFR